MEIDGACLCGDVSWKARIDPEKVWICHCTDCQINSATAYRYGVRVAASDFELLSGVLKVFVKTAENGNKRALSFCPGCGTSIHGGRVGVPDWYSLRLGSCNQRHALTPKGQIWHRSAQPWIEDIGDIPKFPKGLPAR